MQNYEGCHILFSGRSPAPLAKVLAQIGVDIANGIGTGHSSRSQRRTCCGFVGRKSARRGLRRCSRRRQPFGDAAADVAGVTRGPLRRLAKVRADLVVAAAAGIHERPNLVIALPGAVTLGGVGNLVGEKSEESSVAFLPEQDAVRRITVTPRSAGLLIVLFDGLG